MWRGGGWKAISIGQFFRTGSSAGQQTPELSRNPKVQNRVHNNPQLGYTLSQMNPVHILAHNLFKVSFNINFSPNPTP
jgi:hypothetical protein